MSPNIAAALRGLIADVRDGLGAKLDPHGSLRIQQGPLIRSGEAEFVVAGIDAGRHIVDVSVRSFADVSGGWNVVTLVWPDAGSADWLVIELVPRRRTWGQRI